jgi:hypothetical protein
MKTFILAITVATATAFAPATPKQSSSTALFLEMGAYDGKIWSNDAKKAVYEAWDPNSPRTVNNFNPFETWDGNSPVRFYDFTSITAKIVLSRYLTLI